MNNYKDIKDGSKLIAQTYNIRDIDKTIFPTPGENELQFGIGFSEEKKILKTHIHKKVKREIENTSEFLYVLDGKMEKFTCVFDFPLNFYMF